MWLSLGSGAPIHMHAFSLLCPGEESGDLIRHFLIESSAKGVHLKGADEEPYFGEPLRPSGPWVSPSPWAGRVVWEGLLTQGCPFFLQGASLPLCASIPSWPWPCPANSPSRRKVGLGPKDATAKHRVCLFSLERLLADYLWIILVKSACS